MSSLRILVLVAVLSLLGLGGCESMRNSVSAHFTRAPVVHTVDGTLPRVFAAATASLKAMNYEIRRSRAREGVLEAASPVYAERGPNSPSQYLLQIEIEDQGDGRCQVKVEAKELVEEVGGTGPTSRSERPIAQGGPHNRFFEELQRHL